MTLDKKGSVMTLTRRSFLSAVGISSVALSAAACSGPTAGSGPATVATGKLSGQVSLLTPIFEGAAGKALLEQKLIPAFQKTHPDVTFKVDYVNYSALNEKLTTGLAGGTVADVLMLGVGWIPPFAAKGVLAELPAEFAEDQGFDPRVLNPSRHEGKLYALPAVLDTRFVAYRKDIFEEAGITAPPKDWQELRGIAKQLTRSSGGRISRAGIDAFSIDLRQGWEYAVFTNGGKLFDETGRKVLFNQREGVEALEFLAGLIKDGSTAFDFRSEAGKPLQLQTGNAAMALVNNAHFMTIQQQTPELIKEGKIGTFLLKNTTEAMFQGGTLASVSARSKNPDAAQTFVRYLASPEVILPTCEQRGSVPAISSLASSDYVKKNDFVRFAVDNLDKSVSEGGTPAWMEIRDTIKAAVEEALTGKATPQEALDRLADTANAAIGRLQ
jgi:ABC-type glycerol-3-phosphate transport system substrate-binding protein